MANGKHSHPHARPRARLLRWRDRLLNLVLGCTHPMAVQSALIFSRPVGKGRRWHYRVCLRCGQEIAYTGTVTRPVERWELGEGGAQ